jgi:hypothetical protein
MNIAPPAADAWFVVPGVVEGQLFGGRRAVCDRVFRHPVAEPARAQDHEALGIRRLRLCQADPGETGNEDRQKYLGFLSESVFLIHGLSSLVAL